MVDVQIGITLAAALYPLHKIVKGLPLLLRGMRPPVGELERALLIAVAGTEEVFELFAAHRVGKALHVEPDIAGIRSGEHRQALGLLLERAHPMGRAVVVARLRGDLNLRLITQASEEGRIEALNPLIV